jgi:uncharacterized protein (UPF0332 family)
VSIFSFEVNMMKTKTVTRVTSIFLLGCAIIFGILFLFRTQRVWAQKYTSNDQSAANDLYGVNQAELTLTKKGHPHAYDHVGQEITYNYVVKNSGTEPISDTITVSDDKLVVSCTQPPDGVLSPNEKMNCTGTYSITQADLDAGDVTNVATASGGGITSNQATETIHAVVTSSLQLTKLAVPTIYDQAGQAIDYSYVILNSGTVTLSGPFSVVDDKVSATCTQPADGALSPGESLDCTAVYTITQADLDAGSVTNLATASGGGVTSNQATVTVTAVQTKSLTLTKLAEPLTYDHVGQVITYTYLITNTGNVTLAEPFLVMDDKTTVDCTQPADGTLSPGESMECTAAHIISQVDIDAGSATNQATASGGGVTSNEDTATVTAIQAFSLLLAKKANPLTYDQVGQTIDYSYVITNTGNVTLVIPFSVEDDKASVDCTQPGDGTLSPGESMDCTATYTITQADLDAGSVVNQATASGGGATSDQATETVAAIQTRALLLSKQAEPLTYDQVGQMIDYSYVITNTGNVTLADEFLVEDNKAPVDCTQPVDGALSPGETMDCTATYTITQADLDEGSVTNVASASGGGATSNQATATVYAVQTKALLLSKTADPLIYDHVGQVITYSYAITNTGNVTLADSFSVTDDKATVDCTQPGDGALSPEESMDCTATYTITQIDMDEGSVTNYAIAVGGGVTSNEDSATVTAEQAYSLQLTKRGNPQDYDHVGQAIDYSYVITNTGNATLLDPFTVEDNKVTVVCTQPGGGALSPGESMDCTATYTITQADLDAGSVVNQATASGGGATSNQVSETVTAIQTRALLLSKQAEPLTYDQVGQMIDYSFVITNTGNVTLADEFLVEDNKAPVDCTQPGDGALSPGEMMDCTATYTVTQADLDEGSVTNVASASGGGAISNPATATVTAVQTASLQLTKSAEPLTYDHPGQVISYTYSVENTGNVSINGPFAIFDAKVTNETCPPSPTFLTPGQSIDCTASYTILEADMSSGSVTNTAYATGKFGSDTVTSNTDSVTIRAVQTLKYNYLPMVMTYLPSGVYILPKNTQYVSRSTMFVIGEVLNNTQDSLNTVEVPVNFYDAEGNLVGSSSTYLRPLDLPASEKGCFKIAMQVPQNWSYYQFGVPKYTIDLTSSGLAINNDSGVFNPVNGDYDIFGQVKNYGDQRSNSVSVSGTLYDSAGAPVGCEYGTVIGNNLDPGQTSGFEINYSGYYRNYKDVAYYKLRVAGQLP